MDDLNVRRYAWLMLKVYGIRDAPRIASSLRDALVALGDQEHSPTWEKVVEVMEASALLDGGVVRRSPEDDRSDLYLRV